MDKLPHHMIAIASADARVRAAASKLSPRIQDMHAHGRVALFGEPRAALERPIRVKTDGERCVLTRDLLGRSPLYYRAVPGGWACSTRLAWLRQLPPQIDAVHRSHLSILLLNLDGLVDSWDTVWVGIYRVPPGASVAFAPGLCAPLKLEREAPLIEAWDERAYTPSRFLGELRGAMARAASWDAPLAISSGVDSTLLGMLSRNAERQDAPLASISYPGFPQADETRDVTAIAGLLGKQLLLWDASKTRPASADGLELLDQLVDDMPHMHPGAHYELAFERWLHETAGATHKVSGAIGDQLMGVPDYWVVRQLVKASPSASRLKELRWWCSHSPSMSIRHMVGSSPLGRMISTKRSKHPGQLLEHFPAWRGIVPEETPLPEILARGMARRASDSVQPRASALSPSLRSWRWELNMRELRIHHAKSPLAGIFPYLDERLWEWMLSAPPWLLLGESDMEPGKLRDKRLLRRAHALEGALPEVVAWRGKVAFLESFVHASMVEDGFETLRSWASEMALEDAGILERGATLGLLESLTREGVSQDVIWSPVAGLWSIFALERWVRKLALRIV